MFKRVTRVRKKKKGEKDEVKKGAKESKDSPKPGKNKKVAHSIYLYSHLPCVLNHASLHTQLHE